MSLAAGRDDTEILKREGAFVAALALVASMATWASVGQGVPSLEAARLAVLALAFLAARLIPLRLPRGQEVCITTVVSVYGLGTSSGVTVVLASFVAAVVDLVARRQYYERVAFVRRALDALRSTAVVGLAAPFHLLLRPATVDSSSGNLILLLGAGVGFVLVGLELATLAATDVTSSGGSLGGSLRGLVRSLGAVYLVHLAMAVSALRVYAVLGASAFAVTVALTLILQNSFNLYLRIRRAYSETIGALARAAELDRPEDSGHAQRVADLATSVGRLMGLRSPELERLRYAALLHDIGRLGAPETAEEDEHALRGAEIVAAIPFLEDVAPLIEGHHGGDEVPVSASIIGVCSRYDRLRREVGVAEALQSLFSDEAGIRLVIAHVLERVVRE
jgi:putative nucleotidyltransferase with HDIG domain